MLVYLIKLKVLYLLKVHKSNSMFNNTPLYVNSKSNHPPGILKNIPLGVNKRLCQISSNEEVFKAAVRPYQEALDRSGYKVVTEVDKFKGVGT